jgi:hypothetical protein
VDTPEIRAPEGGPLITPPPGWQQPGYGYPPYPPHRPTNSMAIAAMVVALVSLISCPLIGGVAVYLGNRARAEIRASGEDGDGMALTGVIVGWCAVGLAVLLVLVMVAYFGFFALMFTSMAGTSAAS